jgi:hypothetical protein
MGLRIMPNHEWVAATTQVALAVSTMAATWRLHLQRLGNPSAAEVMFKVTALKT